MHDAVTSDRPARRTWSGTIERSGSFLLAFAAAVASAVLGAWASQARQDEEIRRNTVAIAVIQARLDAISAKLDDIRAAVLPPAGAGRKGAIGE